MFNVTDITDFVFCNRKFYIKEVYKIKEEETASIFLGSLKHKFFDIMNKEDRSILQEINKYNYRECKDIFRKRYFDLIPKLMKVNEAKLSKFNLVYDSIVGSLKDIAMIEASYKSRIVKDFIEKNNMFGKDLELWFKPRIVTELRIQDDDVLLKGVIDRVEFYDEFVFPIEIKTGKPSLNGLWHGHRLQLSAYALLLTKKYKKRIEDTAIWYVDHKLTYRLRIIPFMFDEVVRCVKLMKGLLSGEIPRKGLNERKCMRCGLREFCYSLD